MLVSFFESAKYIGHLIPVAFMRIFVGYYFFQEAMLKGANGFLTEPRLARWIDSYVSTTGAASGWYESFLVDVVVPNWQIFAYSIYFVEFLIGISFVLGFMVRPITLIGLFLSVNYLHIMVDGPDSLYRFLIALFFTMGWVGAGRCLGVDYFFFKRNRGIWW